MWIGVRQRFGRFHAALNVTADQVEDAWTKQLGVRQSLQRAYYNTSTDQPPGLIVGSWGKGTHRRPPKDVDVFFQMPPGEFSRINNLAGNKQSALLQEVKSSLQDTYRQTDMRGDGQVVMVRFNTLTVEVVPAFLLTDGKYWMPDTNDGGRWRTANPVAEIANIENVDAATNRNTRALIKIMKCWKDECSVPLKSFVVELLVTQFMRTYQYAQHDYYWYDWFVRDFLIYMAASAWGSVYSPSGGDVIYLGNDWHSRAERGRDRALKACDYELNDHTIAAGEEWQKIFGTNVPIHVL